MKLKHNENSFDLVCDDVIQTDIYQSAAGYKRSLPLYHSRGGSPDHGLSLCTSASAIQQKGDSHFGAMANFKEICGAILRVCYPYQQKKGAFAPFCW